MYNQFKKYIENYLPLSVKEWSLVKSKLKIEYYKKGEIIHHIGGIVPALRFMNRGLARAYVIDEKGKDYTWSIFFNDKNANMTNLFVVDYYSFVKQKSSYLEIEALEDCELVSIDYNNLQLLYDNLKKGERFGRFMVEEAYNYRYKIMISRQTKSAKERFDDFMKKTPYLLEKVPQYHIASYLNISRQHLNRLKKSKLYEEG